METGSSNATRVWTVNALLRWTTDYLARANVADARLCAELLLAHALDCQKIELYTRFDQTPDEAKRTRFRELVRKAAEHFPIAYLIGYKEFYSLRFAVTPDVLIPRPETEAIVDRALAICRENAADILQILDFGTGSGCIAVAILKREPRARVCAVDVSPAAIAVAQQNADAHAVADRMKLIEADGLALPADSVPTDGFDLIVSNPPYIAESERASLPENVVKYEPQIALIADDGLRFYRMLACDGAKQLRPGGTMLVEIGAGMAGAVCEVMAESDDLQFRGAHRDAADPHDRVLEFVRPDDANPTDDRISERAQHDAADISTAIADVDV